MAPSREQQLATAFKALGHPVRLQIVGWLARHGACFAGSIAEQLPVAASTASQHLRILRDAGLVSGTIDGPHRCYCLRKDVFENLRKWLDRL